MSGKAHWQFAEGFIYTSGIFIFPVYYKEFGWLPEYSHRALLVLPVTQYSYLHAPTAGTGCG